MHQRASRLAGKDGINGRKVAPPAGLSVSAEGRTGLGSKRVGQGLAGLLGATCTSAFCLFSMGAGQGPFP